MMLATTSFFGTPLFQLMTAVMAGLVVFLLIWFLLGTAARARKDKAFAARMKAIGKPEKKREMTSASTVAGGWIPETFTSFGQRFAERQGFSERLDAQLEAAGFSVRSGEFVIGTVGCALLGAVLGAALLGTPLMAIGVGALCGVVPHFLLKIALRRRADKLREQLPDVLTVLASSLRAGHSFMQALDTVAKEIAAPAAAEFQRVVAEVRLGRPIEEALEALADRVGSSDFRWAVLAVNIQREVGGNLAEILDTVADTLRERAMMRRQIRVLTAEGRLSAWVLGLMPVAILLLMLAENREYISLLWTTTPGLVMLIGGASFLVAGLLWMRKIVDIDV
jgi:tight adherence protein B